jgi:hypothetical protein
VRGCSEPEMPRQQRRGRRKREKRGIGEMLIAPIFYLASKRVKDMHYTGGWPRETVK